MSTRRRKEIGVRLKRGKYQVFANVNGTFRSVPGGLPITSTPGERAAARERLIEQWGGVPTTAGSLAADIETYLAKPKIARMPTLNQRKAHLALWCAALGPERVRLAIRPDDIEAVLQDWLQTLAPGTVYVRRMALQSLFTVLDGKDARNPVRGTTRPNPSNEIDKGLDFAVVEKILAAMPDRRWLKTGIWVPSASKLRAAVILYTGIPPAELRKLRRHMFEPDAMRVRMPWRDKGAGVEPHYRQLVEEGVAALLALDAAGLWATFGRNALGRAFKRACRAVLGRDTPVSVYWLRHSFATDVMRVTKDTATVGRLLGHAVGSKVTLRYVKGALAEVDRAALTAVRKFRGAKKGLKKDLKLPAKLPASGNVLKIQAL